MGGADKVKRQHDGGKLTVRERIDGVARPRHASTRSARIAGGATYDDDGALADFTPAQLRVRPRPHRRPAGRGRRRRLHGARRRGRCVDLREAGRGRADGGRAAHADRAAGRRHRRRRLGEDARDAAATPTCRAIRAGTAWSSTTSRTVPVVALGPRARSPASARRASCTSHYSLMVKGISQMFVAGPPVVARLRREASPRRSSAAADIHARNGAVDDEVESEDEAFARARRFLSYLPSSVYELPPRAPSNDDPDRREDRCCSSAIPRDRAQGLHDAADRRGRASTAARFFEIGKLCGPLGHHRPRPARRLAGRASWRAIRTSTAAAGPPTPRTRSRASSTSPRRSICRSCTSSTSRASSSASQAEKAGTIRHGARALGRDLPGAACRGARSSAQGRSASAGAAHQNCARATLSATPGRRATGARCRSRAASRPPTRPSSTRRPIRRPSSPRSRRGSTTCARRSAPPSASASRRSSTRATPARCCASSPIAAPLRKPGPVAASRIGRHNFLAILAILLRSWRELFLRLFHRPQRNRSG